jgi:hypothetical protein
LPKKRKEENRISMAIVTVKNGICTMQNITSPISQSIKKKYIGRYEVINVLGRGAFGTVKQGIDPVDGQSVSIGGYFECWPEKRLLAGCNQSFEAQKSPS